MQTRISVYGLYPEFLDWLQDWNEKQFLETYQTFLATKEYGDAPLIPLLVQARLDQRLEEIIRQDLSAITPSEKNTLLKTLALPYAVRMLNEGIFPPHADLDGYALTWIKARTVSLFVNNGLIQFYNDFGLQFSADELRVLLNFVEPEDESLAEHLQVRLQNPQLVEKVTGVKRQAWLEQDEALHKLISGNSIDLNNGNHVLESVDSFISLASSDSFVDIDLNDGASTKLNESSIILLLQEYLKQALYKANNPPAGEYSTIMHFFHHSKESKDKVIEAINALDNTTSATAAIQIVSDLLKRHETPGSGLHTNSVDTYLLQFLYAEGSLNNHHSKGLLLFSIDDLKKYRFSQPNEEGLDCNGRIARSLRGKDRLPDSLDREEYRIGAIRGLFKVMSIVRDNQAKNEPKEIAQDETYRLTSKV